MPYAAQVACLSTTLSRFQPITNRGQLGATLTLNISSCWRQQRGHWQSVTKYYYQTILSLFNTNISSRSRFPL